jgi:3' exoribonuclease, RNase T-like
LIFLVFLVFDMKYFFDTEFIELAEEKTIDLISIGIVAEDGRTYYAISEEFDASAASNWVKENVLIKLPPHYNSFNPTEASPRLV